MLRKVFIVDGYVLAVVGLLLWGWPGLFAARPSVPAGTVVVTNGLAHDSYAQLIERHARIAFYPIPEKIGVLGVLLIVCGLASLAITYSIRPDLQRKAAFYFLAGHLFLAFTVWSLMETWSMFAGFALFDLMVWPVPALLYSVLPYKSPGVSRSPGLSTTEQEIREAAGQEERNRLAEDLHDSVKQQIYSAQTHLAAAAAQLEDTADGPRASIEHARKAARDAMTEMSALLDRLRRDPIEGVGLVEALKRQCEALGFQTGATVTTTLGHLPSASFLTSGVMTSVFRIAQEALANIGRHARASQVGIHLGINAEGNAFVLEIRDDGCGFDAQPSSAGMGLRNMRNRAEEIGARLEIQSRHGSAGSVVRLRLPLVDVEQERRTQHVWRLIAALIPAVPAALLMRAWDGAAPFMLPFVAFGGSLAGWNLLALKRSRVA